MLARVCRAAWRLEQAERERTWALVSARTEGISIRTLATASGLSPSRVHQIVADAGRLLRLSRTAQDHLDGLAGVTGMLGKVICRSFPQRTCRRWPRWGGAGCCREAGMPALIEVVVAGKWLEAMHAQNVGPAFAGLSGRCSSASCSDAAYLGGCGGMERDHDRGLGQGARVSAKAGQDDDGGDDNGGST